MFRTTEQEGKRRDRHTWWVLVAAEGRDEELGTWRRRRRLSPRGRQRGENGGGDCPVDGLFGPVEAHPHGSAAGSLGHEPSPFFFLNIFFVLFFLYISL
jgi:hypothetical protein